MKRIVTYLTIFLTGFTYQASAQISANEIIDVPETPVQSIPVVATETNNASDSGIIIQEESVGEYYGVAPTKLITTNVVTAELVAYPNPATDYINVILPDITTQRVHAYLHDYQGAIMHAYVFAPGGNQITLDLTSLPDGQYSLRVYEEGSNMQIMRILKQR